MTTAKIIFLSSAATLGCALLAAPYVIRSFVREQHMAVRQQRTQSDPSVAHRFSMVGKPFKLSFNDPISHRAITLDSLKGKVVLVDFWATWCGPCMGAMPDVRHLQDQYRDGLQVIGISLDESPGDMLSTCRSNGMGWPQMYDGRGWNAPFATSWGIYEIPAAFLIDKHGILRDADVDVYQAGNEIDRLIAE